MIEAGGHQELQRNLIQRVNLADSLRRCAALYPDKVALTDARGETTYRELHEDGNRVARGLLAAGVRRGGFVGLLFRNCTDYFRVYFGCARIGAVALPMNPTLKLAELSLIAGEAGPEILVAQGDYSEVAGELCERVPSLKRLVLAVRADGDEPLLPDGSSYASGRLADLCEGDGSDVEVYVEDRDALQCIYTSGTTASPKGVITSHMAAVFTALSVAHHVRITQAGVGLVVLPVHHVGGLNDTTIPHIVAGASAVLLDGWDAMRAAEAMQTHSITDTALTAPMWIELINLNHDNRYDWTAMKTALFSIASLPRGGRPGCASCVRRPTCSCARARPSSPGSRSASDPTTSHQAAGMGDPTLMTDVGIMDDHGILLPPHEIGEIVYRGPQAMTEYFGHADLTAESFKFGWFHSGDLGYLDDDRTVFFVDRKKDMIKTGGENVASVDVAHVILAMSGVADCAVIGLPHSRWTEAVTAFVQVSPGASITPEEVISFCKERIAGYKVPKKVLFVRDLPRTASGKVQRSGCANSSWAFTRPKECKMTETEPVEAEVLEMFESLSNWGRWGEDDKFGTLNLITPDVTKAAAGAVRHDRTMSVARIISPKYAPDNANPPLHFITASGEAARAKGHGAAADWYGIACHGHSITHIDSLGHVFWNGKMYNGRPGVACRSDHRRQGRLDRGRGRRRGDARRAARHAPRPWRPVP